MTPQLDEPMAVVTGRDVRAAGLGEQVAARLPTLYDCPASHGPTATLFSNALPHAAADRLLHLSKGSEPGLVVLLVSAVALVLHRHTGVDDLLVGALDPDARGRPVPLRGRIDGDLHLRDVVELMRNLVVEALEDAADLDRRALSPTPIVCALDPTHEAVRKPGGCELLIALRSEAGRLRLRGEYVTAACDESLLQRFLNNVVHVLEQLPESLASPAKDVDILCAEEREELRAFNDTAVEYPRTSTVVDLFERQAAAHGKKPAVISSDSSLRYDELDTRADRMADMLRSRGVIPGDRVALVTSQCASAVVALLAIAKAGACYVPISPKDPEARVHARLTDAGADLILTTREHAETTLGWMQPRTRVLSIDEPVDAVERPRDRAAIGPGDPLYLLYTSGTTGTPAGVVVEHRGVVRLATNTSGLRLDDGDRILGWSPLDFDASTFEVWGSLLNGLTLCIATNEQVLDPVQLRACIERHGITVLWLPAPVFRQLMLADPGAFAPLRALVVGGDVVSPGDATRLRRLFPELTIVNGYGPTEGTTFSTMHRIETDYRVRVPIGRPIANTTAYVVDANDRLQPIGATGELLVGGDGVARGYWRRPALTRERFVPFAGESRVYRTGDLARWLPDGTLDFIGRIDDQVMVRGFRVEPAEIETRLAAHPGVQYAAVVPVDDAGDKALCAYVVCAEEDAGTLKAFLAQTLPAYMIPAHIVRVDRVPLTPRGKLDRRLLPPPPARRPSRRPPADDVERRMLDIWRNVIGTDQLGVDDDFFDLGGHSMKAIRLISLIHHEFGVRLSLHQVLTSITIASLSAVVRRERPSSDVAIERHEPGAHCDLSVSQTRLAEIYDRDPDNAAFNISQQFACGSRFDADLAERTLAALASRHDSLPSSITTVDGRRAQRIEPASRVPTVICDCRGLDADEADRRRAAVIAEAESRPFRLDIAPLARVTFVLRGAHDFEVLWTMHHIVSDGWSMDVLQNEFLRLYRSYQDGTDAGLKPMRLQYRDYVLWQNRLLADPVSAGRAQEFWRARLRPPLRMLPIPYDRPKTAGGVGRRSAGYHAVLDEETTRRLRAAAKAHKTSLFLVLFAGFNRLLAELSDQHDVITGIPSANRYHEDLKNVVGFLVDSVVIRTSVDPGESMHALVDRVSATTLETLDHAYYPIELACGTAGTTWPEILSTFFNMATFGDVNRRTLQDTAWYAIERVQNAKMEFVCYLTEYRNGVEINVHYYTELFQPATIERAMRRYADIMRTLADDQP